jgi:FixJ family two-component response regulator
VDDSESVRKSIAAILSTADIAVRDYCSAREFLGDFVPGGCGCLIVDQHMPDMTGMELLILMRQRGIDIPVIVITGQGDAQMKEKALQAGATTMLHKPVDGEDLIELIEKIMAKKS